MGRFNKSTEGAFINLVGTDKEISSYSQFINYGKDLNSNETIDRFTAEYESLVNENKDLIERLAKLEVIIMQLRSMENIDNVKLSLVREYIYARSTFYRNDKESKDIRIIVDKSEFHGTDLHKLVGDKEFMSTAKTKLKRAMEMESDDNIREYKKIY
jgi:hypothetical protein